MVQRKYFGDNRDYFKYDLITSIFEEGLLHRYVFIPMLTKHRLDNEGKKRPIFNKGKLPDLFEFINSCKDQSLKNWKKWLIQYVSSYRTAEPADAIFFIDDSRSKYWGKFTRLIKSGKTLVFVDPDIGLETGTPSYIRRKGPEKYILNHELKDLFDNLHPQSILMIYQHLLNNEDLRIKAIKKKLTQAESVCDCKYICAYREGDLAFVFMTKSKGTFQQLMQSLNKYCRKSKHRYKTIVVLPLRSPD